MTIFLETTEQQYTALLTALPGALVGAFACWGTAIVRLAERYPSGSCAYFYPNGDASIRAKDGELVLGDWTSAVRLA